MKGPHVIPKGIAKEALVGYIQVATFCTIDIAAYQHFYGEIMMMEVEGPLLISPQEKKAQNEFWNLADDLDYDLYHIYRPTVPSLIHLRVLHLKKETPQIHQSYSSYELGSFSLGFPTSDAKRMHERMEAHQVKSMAPMQRGDITQADGTLRYYLETIYKGPDFIHCVGIERIDYPQLAPCDPETGFGGPGYSAFVAKDSDAEISFYTEVLDHYVLFDNVWESAEGSALGIDPGIPFRFAAVYSPGAKQNHFLLLDFTKEKNIETGVQSCLPNQGLGMYTFQTRSIKKVLERAKAHNAKILSAERKINDPILGEVNACLLETPNGFYIEIIEAL